MRIGTHPAGMNRIHGAGVTSLHSNAGQEFQLASGRCESLTYLASQAKIAQTQYHHYSCFTRYDYTSQYLETIEPLLANVSLVIILVNKSNHTRSGSFYNVHP